MTDFQEGQYVTVDEPNWPGVYKIAGGGRVNMNLERVTGGRGVKIPRSMAGLLLRPASAEQVAAAEAARPAVQIVTGTVVLYHNPKAPEGLYVVLKVHTDDSFNLARLGGDGNRYWPKVPPARVSVVPGAEIEAAYRKAGGALSS